MIKKNGNFWKIWKNEQKNWKFLEKVEKFGKKLKYKTQNI